MDSILFIILQIIAVVLLSVLILLILVISKLFVGKSIGNPSYPPVAGTVFHQFFHFKRVYDFQARIAKKHPTFRLLTPKKDQIYTTDPRNVEHILKTNFHKYSKGRYTQEIIADLLGQGIFVVNGDDWRHQRKLASFQFSTRILRDFSCKVFRTNASKLVRIISEFAMANEILEIHDLLKKYTFSSLFKVGFGVDLNCLEGSIMNTEANEFLNAFDDSNEIIGWRYADPFWKLKRYLNIGSEACLKKNIKRIRDFVSELLNTKRNELQFSHQLNEKEDILSRFLEESKKYPEDITDEYLRDIIVNFIIAGKDSTSNTIAWFLYMLCKNPLTQERIFEEIHSLITNNTNKNNIDEFVGRISDEVLEKTHYLHAALTETLRLYPGLPVIGRCAEMDDTLPDGFKVKKGENVYYMAYSMGRMPYIWGDDAEDFRPERWLKDGNCQAASPFKFSAFHAGPRICLGREFAYRQMKIVAISLLHFFRFTMANDSEEVTYKTMLTLHINGGLHLRALSRTDSTSI